MNERLRAIIAEILEVHWKPSTDLPVVAVSWLLVVGGLYTATFVVGQ